MRPTRPVLAAALAAAALAVTPLVAAPLLAQNGRVAMGSRGVPPGHLPPPGLCRVWYEGVPPGRQPAPVDCDVAERQAARDGRSATVVYGRDARGGNDRWERDGRWERDDRDRDDERWERDERYDPRYPDGHYDPRYPDGRYDPRYPYPGTGEGRNRAGERPDPRYDRRYDSRSGRRLPTMPSVAALRRGGGGSVEWLGRGDHGSRWSDANRDGRPEQVWWLDGRGAVVQLWTDTNRDGRVDRVTYYANGRPVRAVG